MEQVSYNRRNIGPLTKYGRFRGSSRSARRYTRGYRNSYVGYSRLPARRSIPPTSSYTQNITRLKKIALAEALSYPVTASGGTPVYYAKSFALADLDDESTYALVYDAYRITGVQVRFTPRNIPKEGGINSVSGSNVCYVAVDYDDDTPPTTQSSVRATGTCKIFNCTKPFKFFVRPRCTGALFAGGAFSGYSINNGGRAGPWIDMANTGVKYYGIKIATAGVGASFPADSYCFDIAYTYYIELRGIR